MMQDYGKNIPSDSIAREMLRIRIQPKLVEQYTGLPQESVSRIKRSLLRTLSSVQTHLGRIQGATITLADRPLVDQTATAVPRQSAAFRHCLRRLIDLAQ